MIKIIKLIEVFAVRKSDTDVDGLNINISIDDVVVHKEIITVHFTYIADYQNSVGELKIKGNLDYEEEIIKAAEVKILWREAKKLPDDLSEILLNAINYTCGTNGIFVVRPINLSPPIVPPRIEIAHAMNK